MTRDARTEHVGLMTLIFTTKNLDLFICQSYILLCYDILWHCTYKIVLVLKINIYGCAPTNFTHYMEHPMV